MPKYKRLQRLLCHPCSYTTHTAKQRTGLYSGIPCDCARSIAHDTRPAQLTIIPPATRWSVSQRRSASGTYQIPAPHWTLYRLAQPPYYNNVYKGSGAPLLWVHARRCSILQTMPARRGQLLPSVDCWQVLHPAHLLRGQRLHLYRVSPAACNLAPVNSQGAPAGTLHPAGQSSSRSAAGGAEPLAACAAALFGLSPDS